MTVNTFALLIGGMGLVMGLVGIAIGIGTARELDKARENIRETRRLRKLMLPNEIQERICSRGPERCDCSACTAAGIPPRP